MCKRNSPDKNEAGMGCVTETLQVEYLIVKNRRNKKKKEKKKTALEV